MMVYQEGMSIAYIFELLSSPFCQTAIEQDSEEKIRKPNERGELGVVEAQQDGAKKKHH